jgi:tetratricopeptide (TPR) repeat protein
MVANQQPLVLVFDTCEVLSSELDRWLRRLLAPLCDGKTPLLVLIASRLAPDNAESPGSREGWRVEVGDERWRSVAFDEGVSFTVNEVTRALQNLHRPVTAIDVLAEELQRRTLGVPFALGTLLDMHERGDEILSQLETLGPQVDRASQRAEEEVVEQVTARFLVHLRNRPDRHQDFADVVALSLLREANRDLLGRLWGPRNVRERLRALATRYGLVASGDLHVTVRAFLRRRWRMEDRPELVDQMIQRLTEVVEASDRPTTPEASGYFEALADRLNMQGWCRGDEALKDFAPALVLALAYDTHEHLFITLAAEIPLHPRQKATSQLLDKLSKRPAREDMPWGSDELLAWWQNEARQAHWLPIEQAALDMLIGLKDARDQRYTDALTRLKAALKYFDASSLPRPLLVGSALFVIGSALRNVVDTAESASEAYRLAIRIGYLAAEAWNNLAVLAQFRRKLEDTEEFLRKALTLDPTEPLYPCNLGHIYRVQKDYAAAEKWYRQAWTLDPTEPLYPCNLGHIYRVQKDYAAAEKWYRQALAIVPTEHPYLLTLGHLYLAQKDYAAAEEWYHKALAVEEKYAPAYSGLGLFYWAPKRSKAYEEQFRQALAIAPTESLYPWPMVQQKRYEADEERYYKAFDVDAQHAAAYNALGILDQIRKRPEAAEEWYRKALELDPTEPLYPRNLGDLYEKQKRYAAAEEWYRKALVVDEKCAPAYNDLGLLAKAQGQWDTTVAQFKKALKLLLTEVLPPHNPEDIYEALQRFEETEAWHCSDADVLCAIARLLYLTSTDLIKAERFATRAVEIGPGDNHTLHLLACLRLATIQLRRHGWDYASSRILEWLRRSDREFIRESRDDVLELFRVVLSLGRASELATMLYQLDNGTHWLPWAEAIASLSDADSAQLLSEEARAIRDELA